jgi:uncharacterized protein
MGERSRYEPGTFCWVGLATSDPESASSFYERLFGWEVDTSPSTYTVFRLGGKAVAALYPQTAMARAADVAPHWTSFVSVEDADASAARAQELGATLPREPFDVADEGRVATLRDPVGAIVSLWEPRSRIGAELVNDVGCLCWNELATPDTERATAFYAALLGWEFETSPAGYATISNGGVDNGGIRPLRERDDPDAAPNWVPYFTVENVDDAVHAAAQASGTALGPTMELGEGRIAVLADRHGASFVVYHGITDA